MFSAGRMRRVVPENKGWSIRKANHSMFSSFTTKSCICQLIFAEFSLTTREDIMLCFPDQLLFSHLLEPKDFASEYFLPRKLL